MKAYNLFISCVCHHELVSCQISHLNSGSQRVITDFCNCYHCWWSSLRKLLYQTQIWLWFQFFTFMLSFCRILKLLEHFYLSKILEHIEARYDYWCINVRVGFCFPNTWRLSIMRQKSVKNLYKINFIVRKRCVIVRRMINR